MSTKRHTEAVLGGLSPRFPEHIDDLNEAVNGAGFNGIILDGILAVMAHKASRDRLESSDGYWWFWCVRFDTPHGPAIFALPWSQDWGESDDLQLDRSIAVYAEVSITDEVLDELCLQLCTEFMKLPER